MLRHIAALHAHPLDAAMLEERLGLASAAARRTAALRRPEAAARTGHGAGRAARGRVRRRATAGLDPAVRRSVWEIMEELREDGATMMLTTH